MYECRVAAKRFYCASTFTKCRRMQPNHGGNRMRALSNALYSLFLLRITSGTEPFQSFPFAVKLPPGILPTFPSLPCRSLCTNYERACRLKDEVMMMP